MNSTLPRRSGFAVWRWKWRVWVALTPLFVAIYLLSVPLAFFPFMAGGSGTSWPAVPILNVIYWPASVVADCFPILYDIWRWELDKTIEIAFMIKRMLQNS